VEDEMIFMPFITGTTGIVTKEAKQYLEISLGKHSIDILQKQL
jgi:hypothetical protein